MANTRVKICGMTRPEDAAKAAELGADAIGLNFVGGPREIDHIKAREIIDALVASSSPEPIPTRENLAILVALCNAPASRRWDGKWPGDLRYLRIQRFQVYGEDKVRLLSEPHPNDGYWKVAPVATRASLTDLAVELGLMSWKPQALVLDTASADKLGGTGQTFNWHWIAEARAAGELAGLPPIILAGGLNPENVAEAIRIAQPYAVDVSSGVEVAGKPGVKDAMKMRDFIQAVRGAG